MLEENTQKENKEEETKKEMQPINEGLLYAYQSLDNLLKEDLYE